MKALLLIDMPNACGDCRFCDYNDSIKTSFCTADTSHIFSMQEEGGVYTMKRNKQCPLKPMPSKKKVIVESKPKDYFSEYAEGWNACIRAVLGVGEFEELEK